jgi:hypothetical protein
MHKRIAKKFDKAVFSINTVVNHIANQVAHTRSSSSEVIAIPEVAEEHSNGQEARLIALQALADGDLQSTPLEPPPATPTGLQTKSIDSEIAQKAELAVQAAQDDRSPLAATDELAVDDKSSSSGPPWYFGADFTLLLLIHEARDLPAIDPDTDSCNGWVVTRKVEGLSPACFCKHGFWTAHATWHIDPQTQRIANFAHVPLCLGLYESLSGTLMEGPTLWLRAGW